MPRARELEIACAALDALEATTGVEGRAVSPAQGIERDLGFDVAVEVSAGAGGSHALYYAMCKEYVDRHMIVAEMKRRVDKSGLPGLLVTPHLTDAMIDACRAIGLQALDTAGNAYLDAPGLYVLVKGQEAAMARIAPTTEHRSGSSAALRMIFVLLVDPALAQAPYRAIATSAGIALGGVGPILRDLAQRGLITGRDRTYGRRILEPQRLLDEWAVAYPIRLRPKLRPQRFQAPDPMWWQGVDAATLGAWWGGDIAADRLTGQLQPATHTLYIAPDHAEHAVRELVARHRLRPDPQGNIELLDAFWALPRDTQRPDLAPPLLVYADLVASLDPRSLAIAKTIRDMALADVHHPR